MTVVASAAPSCVELGVPIAAIMSGEAALGAGALALATVAHMVLALHLSAPIRGALAWPLGHLVNGALMFRAGSLAWRDQGVWWRGTFYPRTTIDAGRRMAIPSMRIQRTLPEQPRRISQSPS